MLGGGGEMLSGRPVQATARANCLWRVSQAEAPCFQEQPTGRPLISQELVSNARYASAPSSQAALLGSK